jgi:hypothetical protein
MLGKGFKELRNERIAEGIPSGKIEAKGNEQYCIYFGRVHLHDHETQIEARGVLKIGRGKFVTTIARGRNQGGSDFRAYARIIVPTNEETWLLEKDIKRILKHKHTPGSQGQTELYAMSDSELKTFLQSYSKTMTPNATMRIYI